MVNKMEQEERKEEELKSLPLSKQKAAPPLIRKVATRLEALARQLLFLPYPLAAIKQRSTCLPKGRMKEVGE